MEKTDGCWLWTAPVTAAGYGKIAIPGKKSVSAHRMAYELTVGPIPAGLMVCHHCDIKRCVNPDHLFLGTARDNSHDAMKKGLLPHGPTAAVNRHPETRARGERQGAAKLTDAQVREIKRILRAGLLSQRSLARLLGVSERTIGWIANGKRWTHIP